MKISNEHFEQLKKELFLCLKDHGLHPFMVSNNSQAWEVFYKASPMWIYDHYNDNHINTALNKIFKK